MKKNKISKNWINKQRRDIYVRQSKVDGYRARSAYKLIEINEKFKILKGGMIVVDIGAAPGSWSQYASKIVKNSGHVISIDLKKMDEIKNTTQISGDFTEPDIQEIINVYRHTYIHTDTQRPTSSAMTHRHARSYIHIRTRIHTRKQTHTHTRTRTRTLTLTRTRTRTRTRTLTLTLTLTLRSSTFVGSATTLGAASL